MDTNKLDALLQKDGEALMKAAIKKGKEGDPAALRLVLDRLVPTRERVVKIALPEINDIKDVSAAVNVVLRAVAAGELVPSEGERLSKLLSDLRVSYEAGEMALRLQALEQRMGNM